VAGVDQITDRNLGVMPLSVGGLARGLNRTCSQDLFNFLQPDPAEKFLSKGRLKIFDRENDRV
jgi:hypothetical protein